MVGTPLSLKITKRTNQLRSMEKWEGKVSSTLTKANANQIWPLFIDFFNFHKWFPNLSTCYGVHGTNGEVGGTRYCAGSSLPNKDGDADQVSWSKERLVAVDHENMAMSYEMVDCNVGFKSYLSTIRVVGGDGKGCVIEWLFSVNPIDGLTYEDLFQRYQTRLDQTTKKMEDSLVQNNG
ncbi:putative polyketide cyclase/dehydrase, START-like domain superfamily [Helianthus annuus]|nr:putative polyketide cyclase/dehydrase, START-like domain superfamily [Helianthus annuus]KAJ0872949.1 putative polyketide cyclase/dehydrase, START-like domain superfamily [Helianthus annuus]